MAKPEIGIRRASAGDENALAVVGAATFLESFIDQITGPDLIQHCQNQHAPEAYLAYLSATDPRYACWLVEYLPTGVPIGYGVTCPPDLPVDGLAGDIELKRIYSFSKFHGSGAGRLISEAADAYGLSLGCTRILLGTYKGNARAIAFYHREGYRQIGTRAFHVGKQVYDDIVMAKPLV